MQENPDIPHGIILNPLANAGLAQEKWQRLLKDPQAKKLGLLNAPVFLVNENASENGPLDQVTEWTRSKLDAGARNFVAAGGDGTVNLVLNALMRIKNQAPFASDVKLGGVALGSSNDFHKPQDLAHRQDISGCRARLNFNEAKALDVGMVSAGRTNRYFLINASIGAMAEAANSLNQDKKLGFLKRHNMDLAAVAAGLQTIMRFAPLNLVVELDGTSLGALEIYNCGVVKIPHFAGQMRYDSPFEPSNGKFYVHLVSKIGRWAAIKLMLALWNGKFSGLSKTKSFTATRLRLYADRDFALECDGEIVQCREALLEVIPQAFLVCP
ncbi:MAG TPA: diacylglycerol kinase family protein [Myxococcota bacterium]|nr:diacylglycerol kinase family protein [Myxococcota bacterium]